MDPTSGTPGPGSGQHRTPRQVDAGRRTSLGLALRGLTAAGVLLSAVVHLQLWVDGMRSVEIVGPAFMLNAVGGLALGIGILVWRHWLPLLAAIGFALSTLAAFVLSVTVGLFGVQEVATGVPQALLRRPRSLQWCSRPQRSWSSAGRPLRSGRPDRPRPR